MRVRSAPATNDSDGNDSPPVILHCVVDREHCKILVSASKEERYRMKTSCSEGIYLKGTAQ